MRLLLDTHIWLWSLLEPGRLSRRAQRALRADGSELWLSPISHWEFLVLVERQCLRLRGDPFAWLEDALRTAPLREAPLTSAVVLALRGIDTPHRDPADRFLAATAAALDLQLLTSDENLLRGKGYRVFAN